MSTLLEELDHAQMVLDNEGLTLEAAALRGRAERIRQGLIEEPDGILSWAASALREGQEGKEPESDSALGATPPAQPPEPAGNE